ncbi:MAG: alpha/beta superfamily hydrolase, partial [Salinirussus sp.]
CDASVTGVPADHFFVGQQQTVAQQVTDVFTAALGTGR